MIVFFSAQPISPVIYTVKQPIDNGKQFIVHYQGENLNKAKEMLGAIKKKAAPAYLCAETFLDQA